MSLNYPNGNRQVRRLSVTPRFITSKTVRQLKTKHDFIIIIPLDTRET